MPRNGARVPRGLGGASYASRDLRCMVCAGCLRDSASRGQDSANGRRARRASRRGARARPRAGCSSRRDRRWPGRAAERLWLCRRDSQGRGDTRHDLPRRIHFEELHRHRGDDARRAQQARLEREARRPRARGEILQSVGADRSRAARPSDRAHDRLARRIAARVHARRQGLVDAARCPGSERRILQPLQAGPFSGLQQCRSGGRGLHSRKGVGQDVRRVSARRRAEADGHAVFGFRAAARVAVPACEKLRARRQRDALPVHHAAAGGIARDERARACAARALLHRPRHGRRQHRAVAARRRTHRAQRKHAG